MKKLYILFFLITSYTMSAQLVLNEVLFDPPSGDAGDANGDGTRSASADEFIEFVNNSDNPLDISGFKIYDAEQFALLPDTDSPNHVVPANTVIPANGIFVLFGGGTPTGIPGDVVQVSSSGDLNLNNASDVVTVTNASGSVILTYDSDAVGLDMGANQSAVRSPNITGEFVLHISVNGEPFSPGVLAEADAPESPLIFNELLFDPASDDENTVEVEGDANGDGTRDALDDEFIELINTSDNPLDLSGYTVSDASSLRHTFPANTILEGNGVLVVFGGGTPTGDFGGALVQTASEGQLNLSNGGDTVTIRNGGGDVVVIFDSAATGVDPGQDQSITRSPDITGDFVLHTAANANLAFSPGVAANGAILSNNEFTSADFSIYPNPVANGVLFIKTPVPGEKLITLFDLMGRSVLKTQLNENSLNLSSVNSGVYLLQISINNQSYTTKLVIN